MKCLLRRCYIFFLTLLFMATGLNMAMSAEEKYQVLTNVLKNYVHDGLVNYKDLCRDERFDQYVQKLSDTNPDALSTDDSKAFWINAYNAFTLQLICNNYPIKSINQLHTGGLILASALGKTAWDKQFIKINGQTYSLGHIEHKILRPKYDDPRIHFAIVCAARSCPPLRSEAYEGYTLNDQLNDQGKVFLIDRSDLNSFDPKNKVANLSSIFSWFLKDFGKNSKELLEYLSDFMPETISRDLKENASLWKIKYKKYDWSLNEQ